MLRIGLGQICVEGGQVVANLDRAVRMIHRASQQSCDLIVLPECLDCGWTDDSAKELAEPIPGVRSEILRTVAKAASIDVVAGLTERDGESIHNTAIWISSDGNLLGKHRKINILDIALDLYTPGEKVSLFESKWGKVGMTICADNFPDTLEYSRSVLRQGAKLIASPCAWAVDADHDPEREPYGGLWTDSYGQLTREFETVIIGVSNVGIISSGPWSGRKCIGCSFAMGAGSQILASAPYGHDAEELVTFEVDLKAGRHS